MQKGSVFSNNLKERRRRLGLTHAQIAQEIGVSRTTYSYWEAGKTEPSIRKLRLLAGILHTSLNELIG